jgi:hypothetical protein
MKKSFKKKLFQFVKKNNETLVIVNLVLAVLLPILPLLIADRLVLYQRINVVNLTPQTDAYGNFGVNTKLSVSAFVTITRANGTVERLDTG